MLYQMYRPRTLDHIVGNQSLVGSLKQLLAMPAMHPHTYLFTGPSGCGKTTLAQVLATSFGCDHTSLQVINAGNNRGIDMIREIVETCDLPSITGGNRAYIFDEAHQLTKAAQEALLKVVEDVSNTTYFFFCTTEPQDLLKTLRNRCAQYEVKPVTQTECLDYLQVLNGMLETKAPQEILSKIAVNADGCMREALVQLEMVLGLSAEQATECLMSHMAQEATIVELCRVIASSDVNRWLVAQGLLSRLKDENPETVRRMILSYVSTLLLRTTNQLEAARFCSIISRFEPSTFVGGQAFLNATVLDVCMTI